MEVGMGKLLWRIYLCWAKGRRYPGREKGGSETSRLCLESRGKGKEPEFASLWPLAPRCTAPAAGGRLYVPKSTGRGWRTQSPRLLRRGNRGTGRGTPPVCLSWGGGGGVGEHDLRFTQARVLRSPPLPRPLRRRARGALPLPSVARSAHSALHLPPVQLRSPGRKLAAGKELGAATARSGGRSWKRTHGRAEKRSLCRQSRCSRRVRAPPSVPLPEAEGGGGGGHPDSAGRAGRGGHAAGLPPGAAGQRPGPGAQRRRFMQPGRLGSGGGGGGGWNHVRAALGAAAAASREPRWPGGPHLLRLRLRLHLSPRRRHPAPWLRGRRRGSCCLCAPCPCPSPTCATASWAARGPCSSPWHCRSRWALPLSPRRACRHPLCRLPPCASAPPRSRPRRRRTTRVSGSRPSPRSSPPPPEPTAGGWRAAAAAAAAAPGTPGSGPRRPPARWSRRRASYWRGKRRSPAPRTKSSQAGGQPTGAASGVAPPAPRNTGRKSCHRRWSSVSRKGGPARCWRRSAYTRTCGRWA